MRRCVWPVAGALAAALGATGIAAPAPKADRTAQAERILDRAVRAHGGIEKLRRFRSAIFKGRLTATTASGRKTAREFTLYLKGRKKRIEQAGGGGSMVIAFDGKAFHYALNGRPSPFPASARKAFQAGQRAELLLQDRQGARVAAAGRRQVDGIAVDLVEFRHPDGETTVLGFQADTGLLAYLAYRAPHPIKGTPARFEQIRTGYREIAGVPTPSRVRDRLDGLEYAVAEIARVTYTTEIPDALFGTTAGR